MADAIVRSLAAALIIALAATPFVGSVDQPLVTAAALALTALVFSALGTKPMKPKQRKRDPHIARGRRNTRGR